MATTNIKSPNSRIITIRRLPSLLAKVQQGKEVDEYFAAGKVSIGSYFEARQSQRVASGLTDDEEKLLMPTLIRVDSDDKSFTQQVYEYFCDITTTIPAKGLELEIGLKESNDKPVSKSNWPLNLADYIRYKHAIGHPWVAADENAAKGNQLKQFYIFDRYTVQAKNSTKIKLQDAARQIYYTVSKEMAQVDQLLTLLGVDVRTFVGPDADELKKEHLRGLADIVPEKFAEAYNLGDLEIRADIQLMLDLKVLRLTAYKYYNYETNEYLSGSMEELIIWFKDEDNSQIVASLKARMQEALATAPVNQKRKTILPVK